MKRERGRPQRRGADAFWWAVARTKCVVRSRHRDATERVADVLSMKPETLRQELSRFKKTLSVADGALWKRLDKAHVVLGPKWYKSEPADIAAHLDSVIGKMLKALQGLNRASLAKHPKLWRESNSREPVAWVALPAGRSAAAEDRAPRVSRRHRPDSRRPRTIL